jgi:hypothetical protein
MEQMTRFELAMLTWKDRVLPLHHICMADRTAYFLPGIILV